MLDGRDEIEESTALHAALRRLRPMRRRRETPVTTARGRELLGGPEALVNLLHVIA